MRRLLLTIILFVLTSILFSCSKTEDIDKGGKLTNPPINEEISGAEKTSIDWSGLSDQQAAIIQKAIDLGIIPEGLMADNKADILRKDLALLLKAANDKFYGEGYSKLLSYYTDLNVEVAATRMDAASMIFNSYLEYAYQIDYQNNNLFQKAKQEILSQEQSFWKWLPMTSVIAKKSDGTVGMFDIWEDCADIDLILKTGDPDAVQYATLAFDRQTDARIMNYYEDGTFRPNESISVADAIILAYHYYNSLAPEPEYQDVNEVGAFNDNIITKELLEKETKLPEATNELLPAWKGVNLQYLATMAGNGEEANFWITEAQIEAMSEMGVNFLRLWISFAGFEAPDYGNRNMANTFYLEHLDQIVAWCMEYDIHIQFSIVNGPGLNRGTHPDEEKDITETLFTDEKYRDQFLLWYRMLARRYAAIPNQFTSINLMNEPRPLDDENYAATFQPIINAIWEEAPGRVIVADVHRNSTGEAMAKLGVALSCHTYEPSDIMVVLRDRDPLIYESAKWPNLSMTGILYSKEGLGWFGYSEKEWKTGNIITGDISGTMELMVGDISHGTAVLAIKADDKVIYEQTPEYVCPGGNPSEDICYTEEPVTVTIPDDCERIELSCSSGILTLKSVIIKRKDGITVNIPCISDNWSGTPPVDFTINADGSILGNSPAIDAEAVLNRDYNGMLSILDTKRLADSYGVGFMVGEVGMYGDYFLDYYVPDATVFAYYKDILTTLDKYGIPWVTGWLIDRYGPVTTYPYYKDRTYLRMDGAECYYIDVKIYELLKGIIGDR